MQRIKHDHPRVERGKKLQLTRTIHRDRKLLHRKEKDPYQHDTYIGSRSFTSSLQKLSIQNQQNLSGRAGLCTQDTYREHMHRACRSHLRPHDIHTKPIIVAQALVPILHDIAGHCKPQPRPELHNFLCGAVHLRLGHLMGGHRRPAVVLPETASPWASVDNCPVDVYIVLLRCSSYTQLDATCRFAACSFFFHSSSGGVTANKQKEFGPKPGYMVRTWRLWH